MTIYIVTSGAYSDYHIDAVFTDKAAAEKYVDLLARVDRYFDGGIDEWEANSVDTGRVWWKVFKDVGYKTIRVSSHPSKRYGDESVQRSTSTSFLIGRKSSGLELVTDVFAESEEKAKKVAIDRFTQYEAQEAGV